MPKMTVEGLLAIHDGLTKKARALIDKKNKDYTQKETDALSNFDKSVSMGIVNEPWRVAAMFACTKLQRLIALSENGAANNESFEDSCLDAINYIVIWKGVMDRKQLQATIRDVRGSGNIEPNTVTNDDVCINCGKKDGTVVRRDRVSGAYLCSICANALIKTGGLNNA